MIMKKIYGFTVPKTIENLQAIVKHFNMDIWIDQIKHPNLSQDINNWVRFDNIDSLEEQIDQLQLNYIIYVGKDKILICAEFDESSNFFQITDRFNLICLNFGFDLSQKLQCFGMNKKALELTKFSKYDLQEKFKYFL